MADNEESEITESVAIMARTLTGSAMQYREAATRQHQAQAQERAAITEQQRRQEAQLATGLRQEVYSREFWRTASSENIADHMTVASHLARTQPDARMAAMHTADVLRNDFGINVEQMNRDHPNSLEDRHHALRDALDDYFDRARADVDADQARIDAQRDGAAPEVAAAEIAPAENDAEQPAEKAAAAAPVEQEQTPEGKEASDRAAEAQKSETENLAEADRAGAEAHQDREHARSEEATGGRQPEPYARVTKQELDEIQKLDPALVAVRQRQAQAFPMSAQTAVTGKGNTGPTPARGAAKTQNKVQEVSR
ncbi:hypothetical protein I2485_14945 [Nesterenkonia sp. E16_7]|uniref:hypothetical protein n=1 Tax=unclassified Nesterenkonia TaxID=2629769 RepID=UPI001A93057B|nr:MULTISPECIES: hypothetical protein [unclassified Nesterenkonia]MBO0596767.1 hypothetical protein [Nesterenkonia sp. E16_10]MBO0599946.1 hypothetical protein [Nesterenkonia sp. E16_7]